MKVIGGGPTLTFLPGAVTAVKMREVVYSSDFTFNKFCVRIFPSKLTHARDPLLIPFKIRTQNFLRTLDRLFSSQTRNTAR